MRSPFVVTLRALVLGVFALGACRADDAPALETNGNGDKVDASSPVPSSTPIASASSAPSAMPPSKVPDVEYSIVWGSAAGNPPESFLLEWRPPSLRVLGKRAGALIFASGGVYRWKETVGKAETLDDCDEAWNPPEEPNPKNRTLVPVKGAKLIRLDAPEEIELAAFPRLEGASSYENWVTLEASVGTYVFFTERSEEIYCMAAHNSWGYYPRVYDLAKRKFVEVTKTDEQLLRIEARNLSKEALAECAEAVRLANSLTDHPEPGVIEQMGFESVWPTWSKVRGLGFLTGYTAMQSYAAGKHDCQVELQHAPPSFAGFKVPEAFAVLPKKLPQLRVQGWSTLPAGDAASVALTSKVFTPGRGARR
ncbi:MAG TPA: hypothetical protein VMS65_11245 [Polyangiaceae bacterium]|nr:hypothetical protein [Polyangiaceae bacterium]